VNRIGIPAKFAHCTLESYITGSHSLAAMQMARRYVDEFIPGQTKTGILYYGSVGVGKTHLGIGILRQLVEEKGIEARMVDLRDLFDQLRASYDDRNQYTQESQAQILASLLKADLVLIDELGAAKPTDWIFETLELLIGKLYNPAKPVIVTTNFRNAQPGDPYQDNEYKRAARPENLGDRIGRRMWSRLQQMCKPIEIDGPDWRQKK